jgi:hypothetical protein
VPDSQADSTVLRNLFPGTSPTALRLGLQETVEWFSGENRKEKAADGGGPPRPEVIVPA